VLYKTLLSQVAYKSVTALQWWGQCSAKLELFTTLWRCGGKRLGKEEDCELTALLMAEAGRMLFLKLRTGGPVSPLLIMGIRSQSIRQAGVDT